MSILSGVISYYHALGLRGLLAITTYRLAGSLPKCRLSLQDSQLPFTFVFAPRTSLLIETFF